MVVRVIVDDAADFLAVFLGHAGVDQAANCSKDLFPLRMVNVFFPHVVQKPGRKPLVSGLVLFRD